MCLRHWVPIEEAVGSLSCQRCHPNRFGDTFPLQMPHWVLSSIKQDAAEHSSGAQACA